MTPARFTCLAIAAPCPMCWYLNQSPPEATLFHPAPPSPSWAPFCTKPPANQRRRADRPIKLPWTTNQQPPASCSAVLPAGAWARKQRRMTGKQPLLTWNLLDLHFIIIINTTPPFPRTLQLRSTSTQSRLIGFFCRLQIR